MSTWLFDSHGHPIAFVSGTNVFARSGAFIGRLEGGEVWRGRYVGEIVRDSRLLYNTSKGSTVRGTPGTPGTPGMPGLPGSRGGIGMPGGYRDVDLDDDDDDDC
jgi:hypothetical protein